MICEIIKLPSRTHSEERRRIKMTRKLCQGKMMGTVVMAVLVVLVGIMP
jgi:hypothetical protein